MKTAKLFWTLLLAAGAAGSAVAAGPYPINLAQPARVHSEALVRGTAALNAIEPAAAPPEVTVCTNGRCLRRPARADEMHLFANPIHCFGPKCPPGTLDKYGNLRQ